MVALAVLLAGCGGGSGNGLDDPALTGTTSTLGAMEAERWNAYTPAEKDAYRVAFDQCNAWVDTSSDAFNPTKAADYREANIDNAKGDGCADGIAGLPLAGSGIPVPP